METNQENQKGKEKLNHQQDNLTTQKTPENNQSGEIHNSNTRYTQSVNSFTEDAEANKMDTPAIRAQEEDQPLDKHSDSRKREEKSSGEDEQEYKNKTYPHKRSIPESDDDFAHDM